MTNRILFAGMPNSGKSTYIAALRFILVANEAECALKIDGLSNDERHLNELETDWANGQEVKRTQTAKETWVEIKVKETATGKAVILSLPDLKGESFEQPATIGHLSDDLHAELSKANGLMVFINAGRPDDKLMITDLADLVGSEDAQIEQPTAKRFDPLEMPEEVKIVELLQFANRRPLVPRKRMLVIIASAWDVLSEARQKDPDGWLEADCSMLAQFLRHNSDLWETRVYGVSAQGGELPKDRDRLMNISKPSERVKIIGHGANKHDLTAPLQWLISGSAPI